MSWKKIIGQERIKSQLQRAILENRVASSYCFWGPAGVGKDALALEFAKVVNCLDPIVANNEIKACGKCSSCVAASKFRSPNVKLVYSLPAFKSSATDTSALSGASEAQLAQIQEELRLKSENPYHDIRIPGATQIRILSIRELKRELSLSGGSGRKFVIIMRADEMTNEASNALLKTLEEPQPNCTIILTTSRREMLLPTILSRTQQIHCEAITDEDMIPALCSAKQITTEQAELVTAFAQGSFRVAADYLNSENEEYRLAAIDLFRISLTRKLDRKKLLSLLEPFVKSKDKNGCEAVLLQLQIWIRDGMKTAVSGDLFTNIFNRDKIETLAKFARNFQSSDFAVAFDIINRGIADLYANVAKDLAMINVFMQLRKHFLNIG